jgi:hypothetical protein
MNDLPVPVGDRPLSFAAALNRVADRLNQDDRLPWAAQYAWGPAERCQFGLLAQEILGVAPAPLKSWCHLAHNLVTKAEAVRACRSFRRVCAEHRVKSWGSATYRLPASSVLAGYVGSFGSFRSSPEWRQLRAAGLCEGDARHVEMLDCREVRARAGLESYASCVSDDVYYKLAQERLLDDRDRRGPVTRYLRAWAALIREYRAARDAELAAQAEAARLEAVETRPLQLPLQPAPSDDAPCKQKEEPVVHGA